MADPAETTPRITVDYEKPKLGALARLRQRFVLVLFVILFILGSLVMLLAACLTLFQARRFYAEGIGKVLARLGLWMHGVRLVVHRSEPWPSGQVVYISNHTSALDVLIYIALGLPNTRYFMGGFLRTLLPLWVIAGCMGTFWTPPQTLTEKRRSLFRRASALLARTGESVFLTPEGQKCWVFNRGAFHLAMSLKAPIVPFFITIPPDIDPGPWKGHYGSEIRPGEVHVHFKPAVPTADWELSELDQQREAFRRMYYDWGVALNDKSVLAPEAADLASS
jgi:1-acyl-sn-glycerol-3-phosphate acyltransferase